MTFLTNGIQALQHRWKKRVEYRGDYVEKYTPFGYIPWEYLGQLTLVRLAKIIELIQSQNGQGVFFLMSK